MFKSHLNELDYGMSMHFMQQKRASRHSGRSFARGATCAIQFHRSALAVILGQLRWPIYILCFNFLRPNFAVVSLGVKSNTSYQQQKLNHSLPYPGNSAGEYVSYYYLHRGSRIPSFHQYC